MRLADTALAALALCCLAVTGPGCATFDAEALPVDEPWLVAVKSARLPDHTGIGRLGHHTWFDLKEGGEDAWTRIEVNGRGFFEAERSVVEVERLEADPIRSALARAPTRWGHDVHLLKVVRGDEARRVAGQIRLLARRYEDERFYVAWPGPNSNTFAERVARRIEGFAFELHHNAIGRSWASPFRIGPTATASGLQVETPVVGLQVGLEEGIEVHLLQLTFGVDLWPPALKLPFLPRLGFEPSP